MDATAKDNAPSAAVVSEATSAASSVAPNATAETTVVSNPNPESPAAESTVTVPAADAPAAETVSPAQPSSSDAADADKKAPAAEGEKAAETIKTVLGAEKPAEKPAEAKPADAKEGDKKTEGEAKPEVKKEESSQSADPAPLPTYEDFTLPEGFALNKESPELGKFTNALGEFEAKIKADPVSIHTAFQELGQKLVEQHVTQVQNTSQKIEAAYNEVWKNQTKDWYEKFAADPEIGGNQRDTSEDAAIGIISRCGGKPEQVKELREMMEKTGVGNHPALIRLLVNTDKLLRQYESEDGVNMLGAPKPTNLTNKSKLEKLYGSKKRA